MPHYIAERLNAADASYLLFESPNAHMHLSWVWVFEGGTLTDAAGGVDIDAVRQQLGARLLRFPRFRQRLAWTPLEGHPAWVDDESFKLRYHVQHAALPDPGDEGRLKLMAASLVSQPLDRAKPLWELWVVEGLPERRFALVIKTHHCMMDGRSTVELMSGLLDSRPRHRPEDAADWIARPAPSPEALLRDGVLARVRQAAEVARASGRWIGRRDALRQALDVGSNALSAAAAPLPATPLNRPIGPHRLVNWVRRPLAPLAGAAERHGCSVQELALAAVAGALARFFARGGAHVAGDAVRVVVPLAAPAGASADGFGNRTAAGVLSLPIGEGDAGYRLDAVVRGMAAARRERAGLHNLDFLLHVAGIGGRAWLGAGLAARRRLYGCNLVVSDIPGPPAPLHLLDARLVAAYPLVPLLDDQGLGIAFSAFDGHYHAGLVADWEIVPDLESVTRDLRTELDAVCRLSNPRRRGRAAARSGRGS